VNESALSVSLILSGGVRILIRTPADDDALFEVDFEEQAQANGAANAPLEEWISDIQTFCFEQEGLQLPKLLDRMRSSYEKLRPQATGSSSSASAAAASNASASAAAAAPSASSASAKPASMEVDGEEDWGEDGDDDAEFADAGGAGGDDGWGEFKEEAPDAEIEDTAWTAAKALKKRLLAKAEAFRDQHAHASKVQGTAKGIKSIFSSDAAITMLTSQ
jgi:hypothetical protein